MLNTSIFRCFTKKNATILLTILSIHYGIWWLLNRPIEEKDWTGVIKGVSFQPYQYDQDPLRRIHPTKDEIRNDMRLLQNSVREIRSYGSTNSLEFIPALAAEFGLQVTAGAWLGTDRENNALEIRNLVSNAERYKNVKQVIVGNEALLRGDLSEEELRAYLREVRKKTGKPVSTAEPWHVWLDHPGLAQDVDFIAIHILPYWEKIPVEQAVSWTLERYKDVVAAFPGKRVVITEVGWPSDGERQAAAKAGQDKQALYLRQFLPLAHQYGIEYYIMEAFDQPWKRALEGVVGKHWGIFDKHRQAKFAWTGPILQSTTWKLEYLLAGLLAFFPLCLYFWHRRAAPWPVVLMFGLLLQTTVAVFVWYLWAPVGEDYTALELATWLVLFPLNMLLLFVILANGFEMEDLLTPRKVRRSSSPDTNMASWPKVSLHVAICNEPVEMVLQTLRSLEALDYPDYEVLVVDNNTVSSELWRPVRDFCRCRSQKFRFFHLRKSNGFKAGALNFALSQTHPDAGVIGVVDSDYVVRPDWLKNLVPHFASDAKVALVQAPQDHRHWEKSVFKTVCNWEYTGFFKIGMVHRNESNAIIQHGTMTLIRREMLCATHGWSPWCICEDAELGLRLMESGHSAIYVSESYGWGLTPDTFASYCGQRFRWAYGAVQILKKHWRFLLPWNKETALTLGQKYHYVSGWLPWFADGIHLLCVCASLLWAAGMIFVPSWIGTPMPLFMLPILALFAFRVLHFVWLYQVRVQCGLISTLGAAMAGTALVHTIGKAVLAGLFTSNKPFLRTPKCESNSGLIKGLRMAGQETLLALLLWSAAFGLSQKHGFENGDINLWMLILVVQSIPYLAAIMVSLSSSLSETTTSQLFAATRPRKDARLSYAHGSQLITSLISKIK